MLALGRGRTQLARLGQAGLAYADDTGSVEGAAKAQLIGAGGGSTVGDLAALESAASRSGRALGKAYVDPAALDAIAA